MVPMNLQPVLQMPDRGAAAPGSFGYYEPPLFSNNRLIELTFRNRGFLTHDAFAQAESSSYQMMAGEEDMCRQLKELHDAGLSIVQMTDFDTDGIMSGVIGYAGLSELGFNVSLMMPDPKLGYEIPADSVYRAAAMYPGMAAIITSDVGISCFEAAQAAQSIGVKFLITDHHNPSRKGLPVHSALVDPMCDDGLANKKVCGAYVLWHVLQSYADRYCSTFTQEQIRRLRVFAGIGTVSDLMPLLYGNRQLVRESVAVSRLVYCNGTDFIVKSIMGTDVYRRAFLGLQTFFRVLFEKGIIKDDSGINEEFYGFYMAPMFNSLKRMDGTMETGFDVFFGQDPAGASAKLVEYNDARKKEVKEHMDAIEAAENPLAPYVYFTNARKGICGLLAQKLMEKTNTPVAVLNREKLSGSGRSPFGYPAFSRGTAAGFYIGGHEDAFGIGCSDIGTAARYASFLAKDFPEWMAVSGVKDMPAERPDFTISTIPGVGDTGLDIMLFAEYINELERYRPFGKSFKAPDVEFKFRKQDLIKYSAMGKDSKHLRIMFHFGFTAVVWGGGGYVANLDKMLPGDVVTLRGSLQFNVYNDVRSVQFIGEVA